jgi:MFS family permease
LPGSSLVDFSRDLPRIGDESSPGPGTEASTTAAARPASLLNRLLVAAVIANAAANYGAGTYDTIWSLFLRDKGASLGLISLTFTMFAVPVLLFGPIAGRLVDRRGALRFLILGSTLIGLASVTYTFIVDPAWAVVIILFEATGFAMVNPALYAIVARGSPNGRSSTAQGIFGGAGTVGFVISSLLAGWLATFDLRYPFYVFAGVTVVALAITLLVGRRVILAGEPGTLAAARRAGEVEPVHSAP